MGCRVPIEPQRVGTAQTLSVTHGQDTIRAVRSTPASIDGLTKNIAIQDLDAKFACTIGIGSDV